MPKCCNEGAENDGTHQKDFLSPKCKNTTYVRPILEYSTVDWIPHQTKDKSAKLGYKGSELNKKSNLSGQTEKVEFANIVKQKIQSRSHRNLQNHK